MRRRHTFRQNEVPRTPPVRPGGARPPGKRTPTQPVPPGAPSGGETHLHTRQRTTRAGFSLQDPELPGRPAPAPLPPGRPDLPTRPAPPPLHTSPKSFLLPKSAPHRGPGCTGTPQFSAAPALRGGTSLRPPGPVHPRSPSAGEVRPQVVPRHPRLQERSSWAREGCEGRTGLTCFMYMAPGPQPGRRAAREETTVRPRGQGRHLRDPSP